MLKGEGEINCNFCPRWFPLFQMPWLVRNTWHSSATSAISDSIRYRKSKRTLSELKGKINADFYIYSECVACKQLKDLCFGDSWIKKWRAHGWDVLEKRILSTWLHWPWKHMVSWKQLLKSARAKRTESRLQNLSQWKTDSFWVGCLVMVPKQRQTQTHKGKRIDHLGWGLVCILFWNFLNDLSCFCPTCCLWRDQFSLSSEMISSHYRQTLFGTRRMLFGGYYRWVNNDLWAAHAKAVLTGPYGRKGSSPLYVLRTQQTFQKQKVNKKGRDNLIWRIFSFIQERICPVVLSLTSQYAIFKKKVAQAS